MSISVKDSLRLEGAIGNDGVPRLTGLYLRNTTPLQTTVVIESTGIRNVPYNVKTPGNYILEPAKVTTINSTCQLGKVNVGRTSLLTTPTVSRLAYNFLATQSAERYKFPTYEQLRYVVDDKTISYTLLVDPSTIDSDVVYPVFLQVSAEMMLALKNDATGVTPPSTLFGSELYLVESIGQSLKLVGKDNWNDNFIQTPDLQWWYITAAPRHVNPMVEQYADLDILFNPDGHKENNPYAATLNSYTLQMNAAEWNECEGSTVDVAFKMDVDTSIDIVIDTATYSFSSIADLRARAKDVLPADVAVEFLSKAVSKLNRYFGLSQFDTSGRDAEGLDWNFKVTYKNNVVVSMADSYGVYGQEMFDDLVYEMNQGPLIVPKYIAPYDQGDAIFFLMNASPEPLSIDFTTTNWDIGPEITGNSSYGIVGQKQTAVIHPYLPYPPILTNNIADPIYRVNFDFTSPVEGDATFLIRTSKGGDRDIYMVSVDTGAEVEIPDLGIKVRLVVGIGTGQLQVSTMLGIPVDVTVMCFQVGSVNPSQQTIVDGDNNERHTFRLDHLPTDNMLFSAKIRKFTPME